MDRSRINVFNRLTSEDEKLEDVDVFEDLVGDGYPRFCYLYDIISKNDFIDYIDDIKCRVYTDRVEFKIKLNIKMTRKIEKIIDNNVKDTAGLQCDFYCHEKKSDVLVMTVF